MDGLTISTAGSFVKSGDTVSEMNANKFKKESMEGSSTEGASFADTLKEAVETVNTLQVTADNKMQDLATGKSSNIPEVMMAAEKADIALKLMVQVRNKMIDAYQEIMKMQV